jgi:hypothetical protein
MSESVASAAKHRTISPDSQAESIESACLGDPVLLAAGRSDDDYAKLR